MSAGAIAMAAIAVSGAEMLAATPKAPVQQQGTADGQPAAIPGGTP